VGEKIYSNFRLEARNKGGQTGARGRCVTTRSIILRAGLYRAGHIRFSAAVERCHQGILRADGEDRDGRAKRVITRVSRGDEAAMNELGATSPAIERDDEDDLCGDATRGWARSECAAANWRRANVNCRFCRRIRAERAGDIEASGGRRSGCDHHQMTRGESGVTDAGRCDEGGLSAGGRYDVARSDYAANDGGRRIRWAVSAGGGIPTYGVQGFFIDRDDVRRHGRDERMLVQSYYEGQKFLYELVKTLASSARN